MGCFGGSYLAFIRAWSYYASGGHRPSNLTTCVLLHFLFGRLIVVRERFRLGLEGGVRVVGLEGLVRLVRLVREVRVEGLMR